MRKPLSGALWGIVLGLAVAIILQQQGVWPLDKITVFLLPGAIGLIGILITSVGRAGSTRALTVSLIITIPLAVYGATGFTTLNEVGQLNGGCEVQAQTSVPDTTFVTDTSKQDPFSIDPNGVSLGGRHHLWPSWITTGICGSRSAGSRSPSTQATRATRVGVRSMVGTCPTSPNTLTRVASTSHNFAASTRWAVRPPTLAPALVSSS